MTLQCVRCETSLSKKSLLSKIGIGSESGYECDQCGTLMCESCYRERQREVGMAAHDDCPVCNGMLKHR